MNAYRMVNMGYSTIDEVFNEDIGHVVLISSAYAACKSMMSGVTA
jgi:hypothetical protein